MKIKLLNVSRKYVIKDKDDFYALKNATLMFSDIGFVTVIGKSGSGKSTLLNLIAGIDKPSSGDIYIDDQLVTSMNKKKKCDFYKNNIGILFQQYNLLEDETVLFNVILPLLINGEKHKKAKAKGEDVLKLVNISKDMFNKKASLLSGGEKQRVALARTLINNPSVVLCDEPTGALDSNNSISVMEILKEYSKDHLVIMVSHNLQLTKKYSDRIIEISSGHIVKDKVINKRDKIVKRENRKAKNSGYWVDKLAASLFTRHIKRNILTSVALSISLIFAFLAIGYVNGKDQAIEKASIRQFDFGVATISKEEKLTDGSLLTLTRVTRPKIEEVYLNSFISKEFEIAPNFSAIVPLNCNIFYDSELIEGLQYLPVYNFDDNHINKSLLNKGSVLPRELGEIVINQKAYDLLKSKLGKEPLGEYITISNHFTSSYVDFDETIITDELDYQIESKIVGVVNELDYLSSPKIYYGYQFLYDYLSDILLENLTTYFNMDISWVKRIEECDNFDSLCSYSYQLFPKNLNTFDYKNINANLTNGLAITSSSLLIRDSLINFMDVAKYGIFLFLGITVIGTILILGIISFTSYSEDRKKSAILSCLGAREGEIMDIYFNESLVIGLFSLSLSFILSYLLSGLVNRIIYKLIDIDCLVAIPFKSFLGIPFLFPVLGLLLAITLCLICTGLPILFSKRISLKEELQSL